MLHCTTRVLIANIHSAKQPCPDSTRTLSKKPTNNKNTNTHDKELYTNTNAHDKELYTNTNAHDKKPYSPNKNKSKQK